uniref:Putative ovule protein n=1 Tax=Solanum chacoense TaxID=4108 RepID=A0A0V0IZK3_SOLCH
MGDDTIYFAVGFKSYDITRVVSRAETWYDWVERGRKMMTRMSISQKTMEWLAYNLKEASKSHGNTVRRWKRQDHFTELFCARNYNKFGRYISIIKVQDKKRDVIIIPEWSLNSGWMDIATKISVFINAKGQPIGKTSHRNTEKGLLYSDIVRNNKWSTRELNGARIQQKGNSLIISDAISTTQNESLAKSIVGSLPEEIPGITLSEIRRWVASTWRHNHGINIFDLGGNRFLFEFPNRTAADHIVRGDWFWKSYKFSLEWWSPTSNAIFERPNQVWIRVVGLPLHLWSQKVFREIGNLCGGWIRTEEETELRNHLKWARLKVRGDGESIPSTVELTYGDLTFKVQMVETPARVISDERRRTPINTQRSEEVSSQKGEDSLLGFTEVTGHVGSSYDPKISKWPAGPARDITCTPRAHHSILPKKAILVNKGKKLAQIFWPNPCQMGCL